LVLDKIANAQMLIGVVGEPEFIEEDGHFDCIWSISEELHAVVFSGEAMLDCTGRRLLSESGDYDVKAR
jgi:hypothetical protein